MSDTTLPSTAGPNDLVLRALEAASVPLDAYQVAKRAGVTPMQAGRTLAKLVSKGVVQTDDPVETENDLAARYRLVSEGG